MTEYRSIQHSTEYQMGYKDGFVAGTESGYRLVAKVAANHTSPILLEIPEGSALLHDEVRMKEIERLAEIGKKFEQFEKWIESDVALNMATDRGWHPKTDAYLDAELSTLRVCIDK